jgi:hypothetical protein
MSKLNLFDPDNPRGPQAIHEAGHVVALALAGRGIKTAYASWDETGDDDLSYVMPDDDALFAVKDYRGEIAPIYFLAGLACDEGELHANVCRMILEEIHIPLMHTDYGRTADYLRHRCPKHVATGEHYRRCLKTNPRRAPALWDYYWYLTCAIFDAPDVRAAVEQVATALLNGRKMKPATAAKLCAPIFDTLPARISAAEKFARRLARTKPLVRIPRGRSARPPVRAAGSASKRTVVCEGPSSARARMMQKSG